MNRRILIVSGQHFASQPRQVDLHFIADALNRRGIHVDFMSSRLSHLSKLAKDERWDFAKTRKLNCWTALHGFKDEFIWFELVHPANLKAGLLNHMSSLFFRYEGKFLPRAVRSRLLSYSDILIESGSALLLLPEIRRAAPQARIIYHAADRLQTIGAHPLARKILRDNARDIDMVHIVAEALHDEVPAGANIVCLRHGLAKEEFDRAPAPYSQGNNAISVGDMLFDANAIEVMAEANTDWTFHLFGRRARIGKSLSNVVEHGERPFEEIAAYIRHADIGLAPYQGGRDADYISQSSMKMIQYSYVRLPIVAPRFAAAGRDHVLGYEPTSDSSIREAFAGAIHFDRRSIDVSAILTWDEKVSKLFPDLQLYPSGSVATAPDRQQMGGAAELAA